MTRHDPDRRDRIVSFIERFTGANGYPPTVREILPACGLSSTSAVYHHLQALEREGRIERDLGAARTFRVIRPPQNDGLCERPGCENSIAKRRTDTRWCSSSCAVRARQVRQWLRAAGMDHVVTALGLEA